MSTSNNTNNDERPPQYEVHPTSPRWGIFERGQDEPAVAGIGSKEAAEDMAQAMNWAAAERQRHAELANTALTFFPSQT